MTTGNENRRVWAYAIIGYVVAVHVADTLAIRGSTVFIDWSILRWQLANGIDLFKFTIWFIIPLLIALPSFDLQYFTFRRWKRIDWVLLGAVVIAGGLCMLLLPYVSSLDDYYRGWGTLSMDERWRNAFRALLWTCSWLTGWEFTHRYLLLKKMGEAWPDNGRWLALLTVPLIEALYHVIQNKPHLESLGMGALSLVFCAWALHRRNAMLPFLGHLVIELELIVFLFFAR